MPADTTPATCPPLPPRPDVDPATGIVGGGGWSLATDLADRLHAAEAERDEARAELEQQIRLNRRAEHDVDDARRDSAAAHQQVTDLRAALRRSLDALTPAGLAALRCIPEGPIRAGCHRHDGATVRENLRQAYRTLLEATREAEAGAAPVPAARAQEDDEDGAGLLDTLDRAERWHTAAGIPVDDREVPAWLDNLGLPVPVGIRTLLHVIRVGITAAGEAGWRYGQQTAAVPAVDPAQHPAALGEGAGQGPADVDPPRAAEPAPWPWPWSHTDHDGDTLTARWAAGEVLIGGTVGAVDLDRVAAADLHTWLGRALGQPAAPDTDADMSTDTDTVAPGPQDIPHEWLTALVRAADHEHYAGIPLLDVLSTAITAGYRTGFAAHAGCEITVSAEDDLVLIGDRTESDAEPVECPHLADVLAGRTRRAHVDAACGWCASNRIAPEADPVNTSETPADAARRFARELLDLQAELERYQPVITAARAWRTRILDDPAMWADAEDLALIAAVDQAAR